MCGFSTARYPFAFKCSVSSFSISDDSDRASSFAAFSDAAFIEDVMRTMTCTVRVSFAMRLYSTGLEGHRLPSAGLGARWPQPRKGLNGRKGDANKNLAVLMDYVWEKLTARPIARGFQGCTAGSKRELRPPRNKHEKTRMVIMRERQTRDHSLPPWVAKKTAPTRVTGGSEGSRPLRGHQPGRDGGWLSHFAGSSRRRSSPMATPRCSSAPVVPATEAPARFSKVNRKINT